MKTLPTHLKYVYLGNNNTSPMIILSQLIETNEEFLFKVLKKYVKAIGWTLADICGISPSYYMYKIMLEEREDRINRASTQTEPYH